MSLRLTVELETSTLTHNHEKTSYQSYHGPELGGRRRSAAAVSAKKKGDTLGALAADEES